MVGVHHRQRADGPGHRCDPAADGGRLRGDRQRRRVDAAPSGGAGRHPRVQDAGRQAASISAKVAREMMKMLTDVVEQGATGNRAPDPRLRRGGQDGHGAEALPNGSGYSKTTTSPRSSALCRRITHACGVVVGRSAASDLGRRRGRAGGAEIASSRCSTLRSRPVALAGGIGWRRPRPGAYARSGGERV